MCELNEEERRIDIPNAEAFSVYIAAKDLDVELSFRPSNEDDIVTDGHFVILHFYNDTGTGNEIYIFRQADGTYTIENEQGDILSFE